MGTVWVLQTETKGTGANVVRLEREERRSSAVEPLLAPGKPRPRKQPDPRPKAPRRFRVLDVMTRQRLADNASASETIDALKAVRSIVDVNVYVWEPERDRWRMLTFPEQRA